MGGEDDEKYHDGDHDDHDGPNDDDKKGLLDGAMGALEDGGKMLKEGGEGAMDGAGDMMEKAGDMVPLEGEAEEQGLFMRMEASVSNLFHKAENYLGYSFIQLEENQDTPFCACMDGQVL